MDNRMSGREIPQAVRLALKELQEYLAEIYGERLRGIYLYGSYARGDFHSGSDIDVLIALGYGE
jgi:predicted nucleotidyltransferase